MVWEGNGAELPVTRPEQSPPCMPVEQLPYLLVGIRIAGADDADLVIGEDIVPIRQCNFRHVTSGAIVL